MQRTWSDKAGRIEAPKDSEGRYVKASPALLEALRAHLEAMALEAQLHRWTPEQRQLVFPNKAGRVMQYSTFIQDVWQPLLAKAGLSYRKYHATRHTFATWLPEAGTDLRWVQAQLGHATIAQTADTTATRNRIGTRPPSTAWISTSGHEGRSIVESYCPLREPGRLAHPNATRRNRSHEIGCKYPRRKVVEGKGFVGPALHFLKVLCGTGLQIVAERCR